MLLSKLTGDIKLGILAGVVLLAAICVYAYMSNKIDTLTAQVAVKTEQVNIANHETEKANETVDTIVRINEEIISDVRKQQEDYRMEYDRVAKANKVINNLEVRKAKRELYLEKAKTRMAKIARRKPKSLERIINTSNVKLFLEIEELTTF